MKTRTLTIIVVVLAVLLVLALVYVYRQGTANPSTPPAPTAAPATETAVPQPITGIIWEWTALQDASGQTAVSNPKSYTITFKEDGTVAGQADCNQIGGTYSMSGSSLSIQIASSTMAFCGEASQDQLYLASLAKVSSYAADRGELHLFFSGGSGTMDFRDGGAAR